MFGRVLLHQGCERERTRQRHQGDEHEHQRRAVDEELRQPHGYSCAKDCPSVTPSWPLETTL